MRPETIRALGSNILESLDQMNADRYRRRIRISHPSVVTYESDQPMDLVPPGCITAVFARRGSSVLSSIATAVRAGDAGQLNQHARRFLEQYRSRRVGPLQRAVEQVSREPVYADVRYGSQSLASNLCTLDFEAGLITFPYNGGKLKDEEFSLVEYHLPDVRDSVDVLLIKRPPKLSALEELALSRVPEDHLDMNIGNAAACFALTAVLVAAVGAALVVTTAVAGCNDQFDQLDRVSLPDDTVTALGPAGTARELLQLRRQLLTEIMG
jgi:hypothetical protein